MSQDNHVGFRLHYFRDLSDGYRTLKLDKSFPFAMQKYCPACNAELKTFCTLVAANALTRVRVGTCLSCGYVGYIDRPTEDWLVNFYREDWDSALLRQPEIEARNVRHRLPDSTRRVVHLIQSLPVDRSRLVCDIGCGKGAVLREFDNLGFKKLIGVENSHYRAQLTRLTYGYHVLSGNFENQGVATALQSSYPVGIFFTNHVLEHTFSPQTFMQRVSALQNTDDYLIVAVPNFVGEPAGIITFWLPHLHSFTKPALERLLNSYGYQVVDDTLTDENNLVFVGRKTANPQPQFPLHENHFEHVVDRFASYFFIDQMQKKRRYRFSWMKQLQNDGTYGSVASLRPAMNYRLLDDAHQYFERLYARIKNRLWAKRNIEKERSFVMSHLEKRYTPSADSPIEIQYEDAIQLLVK